MAGFLILVLVFALLIPIGLWLLIERETTDQPVMDRGEAERQARSDTASESRSGWAPPGEEDDDTAGKGWD